MSDHALPNSSSRVDSDTYLAGLLPINPIAAFAMPSPREVRDNTEFDKLCDLCPEMSAVDVIWEEMAIIFTTMYIRCLGRQKTTVTCAT